MSTSSALASARRRRAGNMSSVNEKPEENILEQQEQIRITPMQLLQMHEERLKLLEEKYNNTKENNKEYTNMVDLGNNINIDDLYRHIDLKINSINLQPSNNNIEIEMKNINDKINELQKIYSKLDEFKSMLIKNQSDLYDSVNNINSLSEKIINIEDKIDRTDSLNSDIINSIYKELDNTGDNILEKL